MARASIRTLLPLDRFAKLVGIHPLHFNQVEVANLAPSTTCDTPLIQYAWQEADRVGREEIAQAISDAEADLKEQLGFSVLPSWEVAEDIIVPQPNSPEVYASGKDIRNQWTAVKASKNLIITGGQEAFTLLSAAQAVTYSDADLDGYAELAIITIVTSVTDPDEIAIYNTGHGADETYEIRPRTVTISGGVANITCRREQLVLPGLWEALSPNGVDGLNNANFETTVAVYRHYNDPSVQLQFIWEHPDNVGAVSTQYGVATVRDPRLGWVAIRPATWNTTTQSFDSACYSLDWRPDRVRFWYRAGWKNKTHPYTDMDPIWERAISYFALSKLDRPICGCSSISQFVQHWQEDMALQTGGPGGSARYNVTPSQLECPFGTMRGALYAWRAVQKYYVGESANARS